MGFGSVQACRRVSGMGVEAIDKDHRRRQEESDHQPMHRCGDELEPQRAFFCFYWRAEGVCLPFPRAVGFINAATPMATHP